jgi:hypothetical protein
MSMHFNRRSDDTLGQLIVLLTCRQAAARHPIRRIHLNSRLFLGVFLGVLGASAVALYF